MANLICIVCPRGCHLHVDDQNGYAVTGNHCLRGVTYGKSEIQDPHRILTSTVKVQGAPYRRCPVKTSAAIPKKDVFTVMEALNSVTLTAPVAIGDVILRDVCGTGADIVATRSLPKV